MTDHLLTEFGPAPAWHEDARPLILEAWTTLHHRGGGDIWLPDRPEGWRLAGPLVLPPVCNVRLRGRGNLAGGLPGGYLIPDTDETPYIRLDGVMSCGLIGVTIRPNVAPTPHEWFEGVRHFGAAVLVENNCGDVLIDECTFAGTWTGVSIGTVARPLAAREVRIRDCSIGFKFRAVDAYGGSYLYIGGGHWGNDSGPAEWDVYGVEPAIWIGGPLYPGSTDGVFIGRGRDDLFIEQCHKFLRLEPWANSIGNVKVGDGILVDGNRVCSIWASPKITGVVNQLDIRNMRINSYAPRLDVGAVNPFLANPFPIILEQSGEGRVGGVNVAGVTGFGSTRPLVSISGAPGMVRDVIVDGKRVA